MDKLDELVAEVRSIASDRGEVTYPDGPCFYDKGECSDGSVGCVFGQALDNIDWPIYKANLRTGIKSLLIKKD